MLQSARHLVEKIDTTGSVGQPPTSWLPGQSHAYGELHWVTENDAKLNCINCMFKNIVFYGFVLLSVVKRDLKVDDRIVPPLKSYHSGQQLQALKC